MDNHLHVLLRLDPTVAQTWTPQEVVARWFQLYPPRGTDRKPLSSAQLEIVREAKENDANWIAKTRNRLGSSAERWRESIDRLRGERWLGCFMASSPGALA